MFSDTFSKFNPVTLFSFFPKSKRLKLSKQGLNFIANSNMINNKQQNENLYNSNNGNRRSLDNRINQAKNYANKVNFNSTNYKWNYNYGVNQQKQKFSGLASSTGTNFFKAPGNNKFNQNSYSKKYSYNLNNNNPNYNPKSNSQKKNIKIYAKNKENSALPERIKSVRGNSVQKEDLNNKLIERFINQYENKVKKVLSEIGSVGKVKENNNPVSRSNSKQKHFSSKNPLKMNNDINNNDRNYNNLPFLPLDQQHKNINSNQKPHKIYGYPNLNSCSETNIIINNYYNFFNDANNTYNYLINSNNNNNHHNHNNLHSSLNSNNNYGTATNTTMNNNLATNSTNSNNGNNNIIFGGSNMGTSKKSSSNNFSFNVNNIKGKSRAINSINSAVGDYKKILSGESTTGIENILMNETNKLKNSINDEIPPKKTRAVSTAPHEVKLSFGKDPKKNHEQNTNNRNSNISASTISTNIINSNHTHNDKLAKYEIGHTLGKGAYAIVKIVTNTITQEKSAMKVYEKAKLNDNSKKKCVYREIEILKRTNHKNIARLVEVINTPKQILIIQELVNGISLREYYNREIRNQKGISEHKANIFKKIFKQIFDAMNYLHKNFMAHRDIKLENILMTKDYEIKIIDFGFGMYNPENKLQSFFCGTPNYMPPEIAFKKPYVGQKADLWSLGVLVYKMYCADFPFKGKNEKELYKAIRKGKFIMANYTPDYIRKIIVAMIELDPNKRLTCEEVLRSPWLRD